MGKLPYLYGKIDGGVCNDLMAGKENGDFCFRTLDTDGDYCLHLIFKGKCTRHKVAKVNGIVHVGKKAIGSPKTIEEAVEILKKKQPGFPVVFKKGIASAGKKMGLDFGEAESESSSSSAAASTEPIIIVVGSSTKKTKVVDLPEDDLEVSPTPMREKSRETFKVEVKGRKLTVTRVDQDKGWIQNLRLTATLKAPEPEPELESKKEHAAENAPEPEPEPEPEPKPEIPKKASDDPFFTFADEIDAIISAVSSVKAAEKKLEEPVAIEVVESSAEKKPAASESRAGPAVNVTLSRPKGGSLGLSFHGDEKKGYFVTKLKAGFADANPDVSVGMRILSVAGKDVQGCEKKALLGLFVESGQSFKATFCQDLTAFALFGQTLLIEEATIHKKDAKLHAEMLSRAEAGRANRASAGNNGNGMRSPKKITMFEAMVSQQVGGPPTPAAAPITRKVAQVTEDGFPPGWRSAVDRDGRTYFLNDVTFTTTYHDPRLEASSAANHNVSHGSLRAVVSTSSMGSHSAPPPSGSHIEGSLEQHPARVLLIQRRQKRDHVGFGLAQKGAALVVQSILDVGAAFEAGIRVGDRIIGVDGRPARGEAETMKILSSKLRVSIAVSSNDSARPRPRVLYLTRATKQEQLGLQFYTHEGVCTVEDVLTTGIAYKTGLRAGDHIAAVDGKWPKKNVTQEKILKLFAKAPACFTVTTRPLLAVSRRRLAGSVRMANRPKT